MTSQNYRSITKPRAFRDSDDEVQIQSVVPIPTQLRHSRTQNVKSPGGQQLFASVRSSSNADRNTGLNHELSSIFGGTAQPKQAEAQVDARRDKEEALAWIKNEIKRYDQAETILEFENKLETTITKIQKEQKEIVQEEQRQISRLAKVDFLH